MEAKKKNKKETLRTRKRVDLIFVCCLLAWPLIQKLIFYFGVNFRSFLLAFQKYDNELGVYSWNGLNNIKEVLYDFTQMDGLQLAFQNTVLMYVIGTFWGMPVAILSAYFIHKRVPFSNFFKVLFFLPSIVSAVVMVLLYKYFCEYAIPELMLNLFNVKLPLLFLDEKTAFPMILLYNEWASFSGGMILYLSALSSIGESLEDAAKIDGANTMQEFIYVVFPGIFSTVSVFLITGVIGLFSGGGPIYTFYKDSAPQFVNTIGYHMFVRVMGANSSLADYPYAAAMGMLISAVSIPLTFVVRYLLEKFGPSET